MPTHYGTKQNELHISTVMSTTSLIPRPERAPMKRGLVTVQHDFEGRDHDNVLSKFQAEIA